MSRASKPSFRFKTRTHCQPKKSVAYEMPHKAYITEQDTSNDFTRTITRESIPLSSQNIRVLFTHAHQRAWFHNVPHNIRTNKLNTTSFDVGNPIYGRAHTLIKHAKNNNYRILLKIDILFLSLFDSPLRCARYVLLVLVGSPT